jgi:adenine deaminase
MITHFSIKGQYIDFKKKSIYPVKMEIKEGIINKITKIYEAPMQFICPGFIDSHVHIESSMMPPSTFASIATGHGTIAAISDPHEIANVLGSAGVQYMIDNAQDIPFHFFFGAPSSVPATDFETSGAKLDSDTVEQLLKKKEIFFLSEVMNYPAVIAKQEDILKKIETSKKLNKPIDGHAPKLSAELLKSYIDAGITTDHECIELDEAKEKLDLGMKVLIREGSGAKNFDKLYPLLDTHAGSVMLCTDDIHPDCLVKGHINKLCQRAIEKGIDLFNALYAACLAPIEHYNLPIGKVQVGDQANFIILKNLTSFDVSKTYIKGHLVSKNKRYQLNLKEPHIINNFHAKKINSDLLKVDIININKNFEGKIPLIEAIDKQLITTQSSFQPYFENNTINTDPKNDILKIVVHNRYQRDNPQIGFIKNFGLKKGAIASSVAHDSHNIVAVGVNDESLVEVVNTLIDHQGGLAAFDEKKLRILPLEIAGLMSSKLPKEIAMIYTKLDMMAKKMGSQLTAPFLTLSFMALLVIPFIKISDKGLFQNNGDTIKKIN